MTQANTESELVEALQPIRGFATATVIHHLLESGAYDALAEAPDGLSAGALAERLGLDPERLGALLVFAANEDVLREEDGRYVLRDEARRFGRFRAWYEMLIGGYGRTLLDMGNRLAPASGFADRDGAAVGRGSCGISMYDSIPIVRRLLDSAQRDIDLVLDVGCGSAIYLTELTKDGTAKEAIGIEPSEGAYRAALEEVEKAGLSDKVRIVHDDALSYLGRREVHPDLVIIAFVLHEVLGQSGVDGVRRLLGDIVAAAPDAHLIVIEVSYEGDDPAQMRDGLAQTYYNTYYLLHPFTHQRLEREAFWDEIFQDCGLEIVAKETTDADMDSTGFELGYLLRARS